MKAFSFSAAALLGFASLTGGVLSRATADEQTITAVAADKESSITPAEMSAGHFLAPKAFRAAAEKVLPSVVTIESFGGAAPGTQKGAMGGISRPGEGPTTGVIISPDGYIVTSTFNFIRQQPIITVVTRDGSRHIAKLLGRDETRKLCVLKIDAKDLPVPTVAPRSETRVGQWAISLGVGFGDDEPAVSAGIISARNRVGGRVEQTDANISPANYGGPLIDIDGRILGICVPMNPQSQEAAAGVEWYDSGIGFAVPLDGAESLLATMKTGKNIQPAMLGVQVKPSDKGGVGVEMVSPSSAASKAGIKKGDIILSFAGEKVIDPTELRTLVGRKVAGDKVQVVVLRDGKEITIDVTLDAAKPAEAPKQPELPFKLPFPER